MSIAEHYFFEHKNKKYILNAENMTAFSATDEILSELKNITADSCNHLESEIQLKLAKLGLVQKNTKKEEESVFAKSKPIKNIALFVTQECNLDCVYCYGDSGNYGSGGHMSESTAIQAVDWLIEQSGKLKKLGISFFGGEPLMNFPLIRKVVKYARNLEQSTDKTFEFGLTTNLLLLDEEKLNFLVENRIFPLVSFDGPKEIQDSQRPLKNNKGSSFDIIFPKIKQLLNVMPNTPCRATLTENVDLVPIRNFLKQTGFSKIHMIHASPSLFDEGINKKTHNLTKTLHMLESEAEHFLKNVKNRSDDELRKQKDIDSLIMPLGRLLNDHKRYFPCGAGRGSVAVSSSGDVYLCHRFVGIDEYKLGSVFDLNLSREPYLTRNVNTIEKCSKCFAKYICGGGCYHDNLANKGALFEPAGEQCQIMCHTMKLAIYIICNLSDSDKEYLNEIKIIPGSLITKEAINQKRKKIIKKLEKLNLTETELIKLTEGLTLKQYKDKVLGQAYSCK